MDQLRQCLLQMTLLCLMGLIMTAQLSYAANNEEIDPFDMINFDPVGMKMLKKKQSINQEESEGAFSHSEIKEIKSQPSMGTPFKAEQETSIVRSHLVPKVSEVSTCPTLQKQGCPALSLFQQFVSTFLRLVTDKVGTGTSQLYIHVSLTEDQLSHLEKFKLDSTSGKEFQAHEVLTSCMQDAYAVSSREMYALWLENKLGVSVDKFLQIMLLLVSCFGLLYIISKFRFSWNLVVWTGILLFCVSVGTTWYRLYKSEVAKQHQVMMKDLPSGCSKLPDNSDFLSSAYNFYLKHFTFQKDECLEYYEQIIMDPLVKVTIAEAFAVSVVQTLLKPLRTVGTEVSEFLRALLKDLPLQWQFGVSLTICVFFILAMFMCCGYRIHIPFLLSIEPKYSENQDAGLQALRKQVIALEEVKKALKEEKKELKEENKELQRSNIETISYNQQFRSIHQAPTACNSCSNIELQQEKRIALVSAHQEITQTSQFSEDRCKRDSKLPIATSPPHHRTGQENIEKDPCVENRLDSVCMENIGCISASEDQSHS